MKYTIPDLIKISAVASYPDRSVEYAIAVGLYRGGVKQLSFSDCGPKDSRKVLFSSIMASPYVEIKTGQPLLWALLSYFGFGVGGGASFEDDWVQASFHYSNYKGNYTSFAGFRCSDSRSAEEILLKVYAHFNWLLENGESKDFKV